MALFFLDIRNFTPFVERHGAGDVIYIVRKLFSAFQNSIRVHRGQIIETSGDGFYAAFGFDCSVGEAVNSAVQAGLSILKQLEILNEKSFRKDLNQSIEIGMGLHAGKVATGRILLGAKEHTIVMGYPVNVAARLQSATKELNNSFVVSDRVFTLLKRQPVDAPTTCIPLKGVSAPVKVHLLGQPYAAPVALKSTPYTIEAFV
jgi:adenylate cyclase